MEVRSPASSSQQEQHAPPISEDFTLGWVPCALFWPSVMLLGCGCWRSLSQSQALTVQKVFTGAGGTQTPCWHCLTCLWLLQAEQLKAVALRVRDKFTTTPADSSMWARRHAESASESRGADDQDLPPQQLPAAMPSLDYDLLWRSERDKDGNTVSVWRPVGPPGFHAVGDVAVVGYAKPSEPVQASQGQTPAVIDGQAGSTHAQCFHAVVIGQVNAARCTRPCGTTEACTSSQRGFLIVCDV